MRIVIPNQPPATPLLIKARSKSGSNYSEWSRSFAVTTISDNVAPKTPINVTGSMSGTAYRLAWDVVTQSADNSPANDLSHYEVLVASSGSGNTRVYQTINNFFELSLEMNRMTFGTPQANVQMSVRAVDTAGNASAYSSVVSQTNAPPANVTGLVAAGLPNAITASWTANTDSDLQGYNAYVGTTAGFTPGAGNKVWSGSGTQFTMSTVLYATTYYVKVAAVDVFGTESAVYASAGPVSPSSPTAVDTTAPPTPTGLAATMANDTGEATATATVSWTAVTDTDGDLAYYQLGYRPTGATDWSYMNVDYTNTSTKIFGLLPYTNYDFRIRTADFSANLSAWSSTVVGTGASNSAPSQPSAPTVVSNTMNIQVTVPGTKQAGGAMEGDVVWYEVYASTTTGFTPAAANMLGQIEVGPAMVMSFPISASGGTATQTWFVKIIAVDRGGLKSTASNQATSTPGLIAATNIIDATITNAKINDLAADKITAGSGIINNIIVKSTLTMGDASTTGRIESFGYVAGTTGFRLDKNTFEVNQGSISASALKLVSGANIIPPEYAGFEYNSTFYTTQTYVEYGFKNIEVTGSKFGGQHYRQAWFASAGARAKAFFASSATDYNIELEPDATYIISMYVKTSATGRNGKVFIKANSGTVTNLVDTTITGGSVWTRYSGTYTVPSSGVTKALVGFDMAADGNEEFNVDGIQVELKVGSLSTPSPWMPSGITRADGGIIRTGEIRSNTTVTVNSVVQPAWSINMSGGAQFGNANIRGSLIVGPNGADTDAGQSFVSSGNYVTNTTGWKIDSAGNVDFNSGRIRGGLIVDGTLTTSKLALGVIRTNLVNNPGFEETSGVGGSVFTSFTSGGQGDVNNWRTNNTTSFAESGVRNGNTRSGNVRGYVRLLSGANTTTDQAELISNAFQVKANSTYRISWNASAYGAGVVGVGTRMFAYIIFGATQSGLSTSNANNQLLSFDDVTSQNFTVVPYTASTSTDYSSYTTYSADVTIPGGQTDLWAAFRLYTQGGTPEQYVTFDDVSIVEQAVGGGTEITSAGMRIFGDGGDEVVAVVSNRPNYFTVQSNGITLGGLSAQGELFGSGLSVTGDPTFDGDNLFGLYGRSKVDLTDYQAPTGRDFETTPIGLLEGYPQGLIGRYYASATTFGTTVATGGRYHLFNVSATLLPGRSYELSVGPILCDVTLMANTDTNAICGYAVRYTTDGSDPTATSSILSYNYMRPPTNGYQTIPTWRHVYDNNTANPIDIGFGIQLVVENCSVGLNSTGPQVQAHIRDLGPVVTNTGTTVNQYQPSGGGNPTPPPTVKQYVTTWNANGWATYRSKNTIFRGGLGSVGDTANKVYQGYSSSGSFNGDQRGLWTFPSVTATLTGSTVTKVEAYIYWDHWYNNSGGTAKIATHNYASGGWPTGGAPSMTFQKSQSLGSKSGGMWVTLPSSTYAGFKAGTIKGFGIGPAGTTSTTYYGYADDTSPKLRITYTK